MRVILPATILVTLIALPGIEAQQVPQSAQLALEISEARKANDALLRKYRWKRRVEVEEEGKGKRVNLKLFRFELDGTLQATLLSEETEGKVRKSKIEKQKEKGEQLVDLIDKYTHASAGELVDFFADAGFDYGTGKLSDTIRVKGISFAIKGDTVAMWVDQETKQVRKLNITTALGEERVDAIIDYKTLKSGLSYPARTLVKLPADKIRAIVETFDYEAQE
jgi:uncharacterized protein YidB (DUF937 family)